MRRSLRSWVDDARIRVNNIIGDWDDVRGGRGGGRRSFLTRLSGGWNQCSDEHIPAFTRDLASGGTKQLVILLLCLLCVFTIVHWMLLPASVNSLVPAPSLCASQVRHSQLPLPSFLFTNAHALDCKATHDVL